MNVHEHRFGHVLPYVENNVQDTDMLRKQKYPACARADYAGAACIPIAQAMGFTPYLAEEQPAHGFN